MDKKEFMALSLPYELKCMIRMADIKTLTMYDFDSYQYHYRGCHKKFESTFPILHPLSDLTKEIEHKGKKFVPVSKIIDDERRDYSLEHLLRMIINLNMYELIINLPYWAIQKLVEWHFDIAGLIEKGEAIDINTIEGFNY